MQTQRVSAEALIEKAKKRADSHCERSSTTDPVLRQAIAMGYALRELTSLAEEFNKLAGLHDKATCFKRDDTRTYMELHAYSLQLDVTVGFTMVDADPDAGIAKAYPCIEEVWVGSQNIGPLLSADQDEKLTEELQGLLDYAASQSFAADVEFIQ